MLSVINKNFICALFVQICIIQIVLLKYVLILIKTP